jgi:putative transposase
MWTATTRRQHSRAGLRDASDVTDAAWRIQETLLPGPACRGRRWAWPLREIINAIFYVLRTGCAWRLLPDSFPPWRTVYRWFAQLRDGGVFEALDHHLVMLDRERSGREANPTAAVIGDRRSAEGHTRASRPPRAAARAATTRARRSKAASPGSAVTGALPKISRPPSPPPTPSSTPPPPSSCDAASHVPHES